MAAPVFRPRTAGEIVDAAFQILRAHYSQFVMCAALAYLPLLVLRLALGDPLRALTDGSNPAGFALISWVTVIAGWLTVSLMSAVLIGCASQAYLGDEVDVGVSVRRAFSRLPTVMGAALLRYLLLIVAAMALLFPALYVVARYFAVTPAIVLEEVGVGGAFGRSTELSKGRKWHILNTLGLVGIIYLVLYYGVTVAALVLLRNFVLQTVVTSLVSVLVYPVVAITECLLYYDARIQSEGLDIELMSDALGPTPAELPAH